MLSAKVPDQPANPLDWAIRANEDTWEWALEHNPMAKLHLASAWYARAETVEWQHSPHVVELKAMIRSKVADILRTADPARVLADFHARCLVLKLFNDAGVKRLEDRARVIP